MKKIFPAILIMVLVAVPAYACVTAVEQTNVNVGINIGGTWGRVFFADLKTGSRKQQEEEIRAKLQEFLDQRTLLTSLVTDEPTKIEDPARATFFWGDADGNPAVNPLDATHIIARHCRVSNVQWSEAEQTFVLTIQRVQ